MASKLDTTHTFKVGESYPAYCRNGFPAGTVTVIMRKGDGFAVSYKQACMCGNCGGFYSDHDVVVEGGAAGGMFRITEGHVRVFADRGITTPGASQIDILANLADIQNGLANIAYST